MQLHIVMAMGTEINSDTMSVYQRRIPNSL